MFINHKILKRLMQKAYKANGLYMANYDGYIYLSDPFTAAWQAEIAIGCVPKSILATMVECSGRLPEEGEGWTSDTEKDQMEAYRRYTEPEHIGQAKITPFFMASPGGTVYRVVQAPDNHVVCLLQEYLDAIDPKSIDADNEETMIAGPFYGDGNMIYAKTDEATWVIRGGYPPRTEMIRSVLEQTDLSFDEE